MSNISEPSIPNDENPFHDSESPFSVRTGRRGRRRFQTAAEAILLAIVVNVALLAFIGYVDIGSAQKPEPDEEWSLRTVQLQNRPHVPPERNTSDPSRNRDTEQKKKKKQPRPNVSPETTDVNRPPKPIDVKPELNLSRRGIPLQDIRIHSPRPSPPPPPTESSEDEDTDEQASSGRPPSRSAKDLDQLPRKTGGPDARYPPEARRNGTEGWVLLELDISAEGNALRVQVLDWKGNPAFKESAKKAVRNWSFSPGTVNGKPVRATNLRQRITFNLIR